MNNENQELKDLLEQYKFGSKFSNSYFAKDGILYKQEYNHGRNDYRFVGEIESIQDNSFLLKNGNTITHDGNFSDNKTLNLHALTKLLPESVKNLTTHGKENGGHIINLSINSESVSIDWQPPVEFSMLKNNGFMGTPGEISSMVIKDKPIVDLFIELYKLNKETNKDLRVIELKKQDTLDELSEISLALENQRIKKANPEQGFKAQYINKPIQGILQQVKAVSSIAKLYTQHKKIEQIGKKSGMSHIPVELENNTISFIVDGIYLKQYHVQFNDGINVKVLIHNTGIFFEIDDKRLSAGELLKTSPQLIIDLNESFKEYKEKIKEQVEVKNNKSKTISQ